MIDYSLLSLEELKQMICLSFQVDKELTEKYFMPKWHLHAEQLLQILRQEWDKQPKKESGLAFSFLIAETIVRSRIQNASNTSPDEKDFVKKLLPLHREIQNLLEDAGKEILGSTVPMVQFLLKETEPYKKLLEELTQIIRQHSPNAENFVFSRQLINDSPINNAVEEVQERIAEKEKKENKSEKIVITVKPDGLQKVLEALLPFIDYEQEQALSELFTKGRSAEIIYFKGSRVMLGEFFRRLKDSGVLIGLLHYSELAEWLSQSFYYRIKGSKGFGPLNEDSLLKVLREGDKPKSPIPFKI